MLALCGAAVDCAAAQLSPRHATCRGGSKYVFSVLISPSTAPEEVQGVDIAIPSEELDKIE